MSIKTGVAAEHKKPRWAREEDFDTVAECIEALSHWQSFSGRRFKNFWGNKEVVMCAAKITPHVVVQGMATELRGDIDFLRQMVLANVNCYRYMSESMRAELGVAFEAVRADKKLEHFVPGSVKEIWKENGCGIELSEFLGLELAKETAKKQMNGLGEFLLGEKMPKRKAWLSKV